MNQSFEKQPKESAKAFAAFSLYLGLGEQRSLEAVGQKLGKSKALMERWSKRYHWFERVDSYSWHLAKAGSGGARDPESGKAAQWKVCGQAELGSNIVNVEAVPILGKGK